MNLKLSQAKIELLPTELLSMIVDNLQTSDVRELSLVSRGLRAASLRSLFRVVTFKFSQAGFADIMKLVQSPVRHHVITFNYEIPELFRPCLLDFNIFKPEIFPPDCYDEDDAFNDLGELLSYTDIYNIIRSMCQEQRDIVDNDIDFTQLSLALRALPQLTGVGLRFILMASEEKWFYPYFLDWWLTMKEEESNGNHLRVVSNAVGEALKVGIPIHTISLTGPDPPCSPSSYFRYKHWSPSPLSLPDLLDSIEVLKLGTFPFRHEMMSRPLANLRKLELCSVRAEYKYLKGFFQANKSIKSIGFHFVEVTGWQEQEGRVLKLTPEMLCDIIRIPLSTARIETMESCFGCVNWYGGKRLLPDYHQPFV